MGLYKTNVALAINGDRVPRGTEVELSDAQVAHLDPSDIVLLGSTPEAAPEEVTNVPLDEMGHAQLKERAKELGLSASGSKADLQERIALHLQKPPEEVIND